MAKKSFSLADLGALNLATGEIDENKKQQIKKENIEKQKREERNSWKSASSSQRNNDGRGRDGGRPRFDPAKYVGAPYNFVPMWGNTVSVSSSDRIGHDNADKELISGEINYKITARTPIIVDDGKEYFVKNHYGQYAIPGSSMCGLIRNNVQVLSQSSLADDIDDYALMFREVGQAKWSGMNKGIYDDILGSKSVQMNGHSLSILENVKAGYIKNTGSGYVIYHTKPDSINETLGEMNYYVLSERKIVEDYLGSKKSGNFHFEFFMRDGRSIMQHEFKAFIEDDSGKRKQYKGVENRSYKPYMREVSYEIKNERFVSAVGKPGKYGKKGWVVSSGAMKGKKAVYIIPECDTEKECIHIPEADVRAYNIDYERKKNQLKEPKSFWDLPKEGEIKPVFYVMLERVYFGFTPRLRLFYRNSIHDGLGEGHEKGLIDYTKSLFGYSNDSDSYKSRVSFSDAKISGSNTASNRADKLILGEPKPTSYADYLDLKSNGTSNTYNDDGFRLRGMKQYWLHGSADPKTPDELKEKVATTIHPLPEGTSFEGKVRFHNLRKEELGLLIWALQLAPESEMNIGKAKPYGYGRIKLDVLSVREFSPEKAYDTAAFCLNPFENIDKVQIDELIKAYKKEIAGKLGVQDVMELPSIRAFFKMKDSGNMPKADKIRYMDINRREYQNRAPLKDIDSTLS